MHRRAGRAGQDLVTTADGRGRRARLTIAAVLAGALLAAGGIIGGLAIGGGQPPPTTTSAEAGFARDMQVHHAQAVEMAMAVRDLTDDEEIRQLAYDIATAQSQQSGQMHGWLSAWGLPQAPAEPSMTWMTRAPSTSGSGHDHSGAQHAPGGSMPGMATLDQLNRLRASTGADAERLFLQLMIAHHRGGVEMADALLARSDEPAVTALARSMVRSQTAEIGYMEELLAAR